MDSRRLTTALRAPEGQVGDDLFRFGGSEKSVLEVQRPLAQRFGPGDLVADIGCGRGTFLRLLHERGATGIGVDMSDQSIEICRRQGFVDVEQTDALSFLEGAQPRFDGIFCSHIIEHMDPPSVGRLIDLAYTALRPGGQLIIVTPNPTDLLVMSETFWLDPTHVRPYPLPLLDDWFRQAHFEVLEAKTYMGFSVAALGRRRLPRYLFLKLILGRFFGVSNTLIIGRRPRA